MKYICPVCGKESQREEIKQMEEFDVRGEKIIVEAIYQKCNQCGAEFEDLNSSYDPYNLAFEEYRRRKGMVQPAQIKEFRKKYNLTQKELSILLGFGDITLSRYENGALQDEAHDKLLHLVMDPSNLLDLIKHKSTLLQKEKVVNLIKELKVEIMLKSIFEQIQSENEPSIMNGFQTFNFQKLINTVRFLAYKKEVYKTKLLKLLFYVDFYHFKNNQLSITGLNYAHLPFGPVPDNFYSLLGSIINYDSSIQMNEGEMDGDKFTSIEQPDLSIFNRNELDTISYVDNYFKEYTSSKIKNFSHGEKGYLDTKDGELISYEYAKQLQI